MTTSLYQLELDQSNVNCGMSYVFQLGNDHFFIIDGGYFTEGEETRLYNFLCKLSKVKPVIDGWYFSHAHQDHVGNFISFIKKYRDSVDLHRLLYSFHPVNLKDVTEDWKSSDPATIREFYKTVEKYCSDIDIITLKKGQNIHFDELNLEVLYTYENLYPEKAGFNDYSTVIMTTVQKQKILWLGDIGRKGSEVLMQDPEKIKCDIIQISHHGIDNYENMCRLYEATEATVDLWPVPDISGFRLLPQIPSIFIIDSFFSLS